MSKKIKIALLVLSGVVVALLIFFSTTKRKEAPQPSTPIPLPTISPQYGGKYKVSISFGEKDFNFPDKESLIERRPVSFSENKIKQIAIALGFASEPTIANDVFDGKTYLYESDAASFTAYVGGAKADYTLVESVQPINKQLSNEALVDIALNFIYSNGFAEKDSLAFSFFSYIRAEAGESQYVSAKDGADVYQVNLSPKAYGYPVITLNPQASPVYVQILPDGTVYSAHFSELGTLTKTPTTYTLKNYQELVSSANKAVLVSLGGGDINLPDLKTGSVGDISITKASLAYLLDTSKTQTLQPVFLLEGSTTFEGTPNTKAVLYLPAISGN